MNWSEFFHMGGYGFYVWGSYALTLGVIVLNVLVPLLRHRKLRRESQPPAPRDPSRPASRVDD